MNEVLTAITTVGFPIVCAGACMWYVKYITDANRKQIDEINTQHQNEMLEVTKAINNNTVALTRLCEKMGE